MRAQLKSLLHSRWMPLGASLLGFLEASFIVVPIEPLAIPAMASRRGRSAWLIAAFLLIGSITGATFMYGLGAWATEPLIEPAFARLGMLEDFEELSAELRERGFTALALAAVTPFPIQVGAAAAGAVNYPFTSFLIVIALARGVRYGVLAAVVALIGARAGDLIERHETAIFLGGIVVFVLVAAWMIFRP